MINGIMVKWERGQYPVSYLFLSQRWNWSVHKARIFIDLLKEAGQVTTRATSVATILNLCNYDYYNPYSQAEDITEGSLNGNQTAIREESKEREEGNKEIKNKENFDFKEEEEQNRYEERIIIDPKKEAEREEFLKDLVAGKFDRPDREIIPPDFE